jgi:hypothetical protein
MECSAVVGRTVFAAKRDSAASATAILPRANSSE